MTVSGAITPIALPGTTAAVTRVVDCEPPALSSEPCPPPTPTTLRRSSTRARHLHAPHPAVAPPSEHLRRAAGFADAALRRVLEVLDRRRSPSHLRPLLAAGLADAVAAVHRSAPIQEATAVLRRVRLQPADHGEHAFEVAASYARGPRVHAIACRVERMADGRGERWQITALHIG